MALGDTDMRPTLALLLMLTLAAPALAQITSTVPTLERPRLLSTPIATVDELRRLPRPANLVAVTGLAPTTDVVVGTAPSSGTIVGTPAGNPTPEASYKAGKGVVLGPGRWSDSVTGSYLQASFVKVNSATAPQVSTLSETSAAVVYLAHLQSEERVIEAAFYNLPSATHTYCLTLTATGPGKTVTSTIDPSRIRVEVWTTSFTGTQFLSVGAANRLYFNFTPYSDGSRSMYVYVYVRGKATYYHEDNELTFYNLQLAQMD
jgi:hypothetical protein